MDVRIGIQNSPRELGFETSQSAAEVEQAVAAVVWVALTWLGWAWDGGWIWVVSLAASALASAAAAYLIGPGRQKADAALFERLSRPGVSRA